MNGCTGDPASSTNCAATAEHGVADTVAGVITCPLNNAAMTDPVAASDGHVYERGALAEYLTDWARNNEDIGQWPASPVTGEPLTDSAADLQACPVAAITIGVWTNCIPEERAAPQSLGAAAADTPASHPAIGERTSDSLKGGSGSDDDAIPTIVPVGQRNAGKSALLQRMAGVPVFPRCPTTVAVHVLLRCGPVADPLMRVVPLGTPAFVGRRADLPWRRIPAAILTQYDRLPDIVEGVMGRLSAAARADRGHPIATDREIQIVVQTPTARVLHLLDLPGLISEGHPGHEDVKAIISSTVVVHGSSHFLWAHSAVERSANSSIGALLRECGVADRTTGVLTNCDRARSDDPDVPDVHTAAALLRDNTTIHSRAVGGGWCVVANPAPSRDEPPATRLRNMPQREAAALQRLVTIRPDDDMTADEAAQFDKDVALVSAHWGMDRLRQHSPAANTIFSMSWTRATGASTAANPRLIDLSWPEGGETDASITLLTLPMVMSALARHCPQLQHLDVSNSGGTVTDASIALVAQHCPQLQHLDVSRTGGMVTDASIALLAQHSSQVRHLNVSHTGGMVTDASIALLAQHCPQLQHLNVSHTMGKVTDTSIEAMAKHCWQLRHLDVSGTEGKVTDASIAEVAQHCSQLQHLDVSRTMGTVTDVSIALLAQHRPKLQHLNVSLTWDNVTDASIALLAQHCSQLQHLDVSRTMGTVTDASIAEVAQHCSQLQHLDVSRTWGTVTDASIAEVAQHCPQLQHLDVSHTGGMLTDASIALLAQHCSQLQHLDVSHTMGTVTDASIAAVAKHCWQLRHLDVSGTEGNVTDVSIAEVAQHCPQLQHLDVSHTGGMLTDASIALLAQHCSQLQHLDVSHTMGTVTDASIALVARNCPQLRHLARDRHEFKVQAPP